MTVPILINCDDLGMHPDINDAIVDILLSTPVESASLMATGLYFDHAVELLQANGLHAIGVHLVLGSEYRHLPMKPLSNSLVSFHESTPKETTAQQAEEECRLQIRKVQQAGLRITHLDGHMFFYEPAERGAGDFLDVVRKLAQELDVPYRREQASSRVFAWDGYDRETDRFAFYDAMASSALGWQEWIFHPLKTDERFGEISRVAGRRLADYRYLKRERTWRLFTESGLRCVGWRERREHFS